MREELFAIIDALGERFGATGQHLWEVLVRQQWLYGAVNAVEALIALLIFIGATICAVKCVRAAAMIEAENASANSYAARKGTEAQMTFFVVSICVIVVCVMSFFLLADSAIMKLSNPEYYALKEISDILKGAK